MLLFEFPIDPEPVAGQLLQFMLKLIPPLSIEETRAQVSQAVACIVTLYGSKVS